MALTISNRRVCHKPIIVTGSYVGTGLNANTVLPLGFIPTKLVIIDGSGNTFEWGYGMGWACAFRPVSGNAVTDLECIFQYLGKEIESNPLAGEAATDNPIVPEEGDYAEPYIDGCDEAGVVITGGTPNSPDIAGETYVFWAIG